MEVAKLMSAIGVLLLVLEAEFVGPLVDELAVEDLLDEGAKTDELVVAA
jgi:hypothetical protein